MNEYDDDEVIFSASGAASSSQDGELRSGNLDAPLPAGEPQPGSSGDGAGEMEWNDARTSLPDDDELLAEEDSLFGEEEEEEPSSMAIKVLDGLLSFLVVAVVVLVLVSLAIKPPPGDVFKDISEFLSLHDGTHSIYRSSEENRYVNEIAVSDLAHDGEGNDLLVLRLDWRNASHVDAAADDVLDIKVIQDGKICERKEDLAGMLFDAEVDFEAVSEKVRPTDEQTVYLAYPIEGDKRVDVLISAWVNEELFGDESSAIVASYEFDEKGHLARNGGELITRAAYIEATGAEV